MMKNLFISIVILYSSSVFASKNPHDFGYTHLTFNYQNDTVDVLVQSKKGEEDQPKPLLFFCQGSLPVPLIVYDEQGATSPFPFDATIFIENFHLVAISKPGIPVIAGIDQVNTDFTFHDSAGNYPKKYVEKNHLDYYVERNTYVISQLQKRTWVSDQKLVVAGHSEGATIAAKLALENKAVSHVIFASGNPMGRIMSMIERSRKYETDSTQLAENDFGYWDYLLGHNKSQSDSIDFYARTDFSFSQPPIDYLKKLKIPVLVTYGSLDYSTPFNDYFRAWCMQQNKTNFTFLCYVGLEHNYFRVDEKGKTDYNSFHWNDVARDWINWISENQ